MTSHVHAQRLPILQAPGPEFALCEECELRSQCERDCYVRAYVPEQPIPLMIVGEGPGAQELQQGRPFVGRAGQLLRALLDAAGIDMDRAFVTNATLGKPPAFSGGSRSSGGLHARFPHAISSCLPRLTEEVRRAQPRVIVGLGNAALIALTGYPQHSTRREPFACPNPACGTVLGAPVTDPTTGAVQSDRKVGPVLQCSRCRVLYWATREQLAYFAEHPCPGCGASMRKQAPRRLACPVCHGLKTRAVEQHHWSCDTTISQAAGAVFRAETLPSRWDDFGVRYLVCTYHPSFLLRGGGEGKGMRGQFAAHAVVRHLQKAKHLLSHDETWQVRYRVTTDAAELRAYVSGWRASHTHCPYVFDTDIETEAHESVELRDAAGELEDTLDGDARKVREVSRIRCIGIGADGQQGLGYVLVVDTRHPSLELRKALYDYLTDPEIPKAGHNFGAYDLAVIERLWGPGLQVRGWTDDTLVAHHNLAPDEVHRLDHVAALYSYAPVWKPPKKRRSKAAIHEDFAELCLYNSKDVALQGASRLAMGVAYGRAIPGGELERQGLAELYAVDMAQAQMDAEMSRRGLPLDPERLKAFAEHTRAEYAQALARMRAIVDRPDLNVSNTRHMQWALFQHLGLPVTHRTERGAPSTDAETLAALADRHEFVQHAIVARRAGQWLRNFIESPLLQPEADGRLHPVWKTYGTKTGRKATSPNVQNWPKRLRAVVHLPEASGRVLVGADYSQLEFRILAALSGDAELIRRCMHADEARKLEPEHDPHAWIAARAFGSTFTALQLRDPAHLRAPAPGERCRCQTCQRKQLRELSKRIVYGLNYGAGAAVVLAAIYKGGYDGPALSVRTVEHVKRTFFEACPRVPAWRDALLVQAEQTREVRSVLLGRRRVFPLGEVVPAEVYNYPIQGCKPASARILTREGIVPIGRAPVTGEVWTGQAWANYTKLNRGAWELATITLANGQVVRCDTRHQVLVSTPVGYTFKHWRDLVPGDRVCLSMADKLEFGSADLTAEEAYWMGYCIGNGSSCARNAMDITVGDRKGRYRRHVKAQEFVTFASSLGYRTQQLCEYENHLVVRLEHKRFRARWEALGYCWGARAVEKRVPGSIWSSCFAARKAFLLGLMDADGTVGVRESGPPCLHMCQRELLAEVQILARTVGVETKLYGPYMPCGSDAENTSYRLSLNAGHMAELGYVVREKTIVQDPAPAHVVQEFLARLEVFPPNPSSDATLICRMRAGGTTSVYKLRELCARYSVKLARLYATSEVVATEALGITETTYTLSVEDPDHRFDGEGVIHKNTAADLVNLRSLLMWQGLAAVDPSAFVVAQLHDALYVETCAERAQAVAQYMTETLSARYDLAGTGAMMTFPATAHAAQDWEQVA